MSIDEVTPALDAAVAEKRAMAGRGKYMVTPAGRAFLDEQYPVLPNDHADTDYDAAVLEELAKLDEEAGPVLDQLAGLVPRLGVHRRRLSEALDRASAGETDYVSGVRVASYHTVWFELYEDLLRLLGRTREP